jgi:prepilin-type processing-associated H-X9-DG protein
MKTALTLLILALAALHTTEGKRVGTGVLQSHPPTLVVVSYGLNSNFAEPSTSTGPSAIARGGANYLAADGHVVWLTGGRVSAGQNAPGPDYPQSPHGFPLPGHSDQPAWPTAEGTGVQKHRLTFSVR